jgi:putative peptidoglycan lipid II flippase
MANQYVAAYGSIMRHIRQGEAVLEVPHIEDRKPVQQISKEIGLAGKAWNVSIAIIISRILGLIREIVQAKYFGAGLYTDAFNIAYRIPNLLRDLFAEGALSSAFIPTFIQRMTIEGKDAAWILANRVINTLLLMLGLITLAIFFGSKGFVYLQAAGFVAIPGKFELTVQMTRILAPFLLCVSLASVIMGMLNACGSFFLPAMASSAFNVCCILSGIFLSPFMPHWGLDPIVSMAIGALLGGISQFVVMIPSIHAMGFRYQWSLDFSDSGLRHIGKLMLPAILGLSATQINILVDNQIASSYGNGPVSWLSYAFRLMQLPMGVFGIAIATITLTQVSHYAARKDMEALNKTLNSGLKLAACLTFPATLGLIIFRNEIVQLLFQRNQFLPSDTLQTGQAVFYYAFALFSYSAVKIVVPAFYAINDTRTPVRISLISIAAKIILNLLLMKPMGFLGLAISTSIASWLNFVLLWKKFRNCHHATYSDNSGKVYLRILSASIAAVFIAWIIFRSCIFIFPGSGSLHLGFILGFAILGAMISLLPLLRIFRVEESLEVLSRIREVLGKLK